MDNTEILLVHLGGLGDVCLSESIFLSLQKQLGNHVVGLGNRRFLNLFSEYFLRVEGVESRKWLHLFSERLTGPQWRQIVFIGKDREGRLRNRWEKLSEEKMVFIDMYPEGAFDVTIQPGAGQEGATHPLGGQTRAPEPGAVRSSQSEREREAPMALPLEGATRAPSIEDYQLVQLAQYSIKPVKKAISLKKSQRVILYPEKGFEKEKWNYENFIALSLSLKKKGVDVIFLESLGLPLDVENKVFFEDLGEVRAFFDDGGIFVSNDSGMAHLAGASGLFTITIFTGFEPAIWHPRGQCVTLKQGEDVIEVNAIKRKIVEILKSL
ncbi:MAG: hypothetical protein C0399_01290 [Syntrophus sp. (in: bacteria)]|nr:hypothetical protein [Syntrophus sp. (in: bacteria)]